MKGYVENITSRWAHVLKRTVGPGARIPLKDLYEQYGKKHNLKKGKEFISWLREVKLKDNEKWNVVVLKTEDEEKAAIKEQQEKALEEADVESKNAKELTIDDVVRLSVRKAREALPNITDLKLLKYALETAKPLSGKDSLCRLIRKRVQELELVK